MISPIYAKRNRGQVVTAGCQWIWEHKLLAFKLMLLPILIAGLLLFVNMMMFNSVLVYIVLGIFAFFILPIIPCFMFHVVENPEEFGYPEHIHGLVRVNKFWWHYFWPMLKISFVTGIIQMFGSFTLIIPLMIPYVQLVAIVICQRDDDRGVIDAIIDAFKMIFKSFGTFVMCWISCAIIILCMIGVPCLMVVFIDFCMRTYMSKELYHVIVSVLDKPNFNIYVLVCAFGVALSLQVVMVIAHFFYGHCKEKKDHPALIARMEQFS